MASTEFDFVHVIIGGLSAAVGAAGGLIAGVWRVAHIEQDIRKDFDQMVGNIRQRINEVELEAQRNFVAKPDFEDFRKEYREDMRDLKNSIAHISRKP